MDAVRTVPFKTRYQVLDTTSRRLIPDCFILFPTSDPVAIFALKAYLSAMHGDDPEARELIEWIDHLESVHKEFKEMEKYEL